MLNKVCSHCQQTYSIKEVRVDSHWNSLSLEPAYCHCPHCDAVLADVYPDTVDLAKYLKPAYIFGLVGYFALFGLGTITDTLHYVAPLMLLLWGAWLAKSALFKDHRIIGWFLVGLSFIVVVGINYAGIL